MTANFAGSADIYAVCQPTTCNPSPINQVGLNQTGTPITSNSVTITTPGIASDFVWLASPMSPCTGCTAPLPGLAPSVGSQYFVPVELLTGTVGAAVKMPYIPNSMVMDRTGTSLYFGSSRELMIYATGTNSLTKEDLNVPGVVLAAAPDNQTVLINDPIRKVFYLYKPASAAFTTFSGVGTSARWTPDAKTLYVVGTDASGKPTLFVNNVNTGWTTYPLGEQASEVAITIPSVGAFLSGSPTVAHAWCPDVSTNTSSTNNLLAAYPQAASVAVDTAVLAPTTDGDHMLGAQVNAGGAAVITDINLNLPQSLNSGACPAANTGITIATPFVQTAPIAINASRIEQILAAPGSSLAFVTYAPTATSTGVLPYYEPNAAGTLGTVGSVTLAGSPTAPIAGTFSLDDTLFFVSTAGDDLIHYVSVKTLTDTQQIKPGLVDGNGNALPATVLWVKPRSTT